MTEHDSDQLVLREAMAFRGPTQPLDPNEVIERARRRRSRHRTGVAVATVAMTAAVGMGATVVIDGLRQPEVSTVAVGVDPTTVMNEAPAAVETVGARAEADLGHGWTLITRSNTICLRAPSDADDGSCSVNIPEVPPVDAIHWYGGRQSPTLMAWQVPTETDTTVVTAEDGWRLPADVYALTDVPGTRLAVVFIQDEPRFWQRQDRRVTSYDSTGAVVADWPIPNTPAITQARKAQAERTAD